MPGKQATAAFSALAVLLIATIGSGSAAPSQKKTEKTTAANARIRIVHAMPDGPALDVYLGSKKLLENVPYRTISRYFPLPAGTHRIKLTASGKPNAALEMNATVEEGRAYTAAIVGTRRVYQTVLLDDDLAPTEKRAARLRVVHFAPDAPALDVLVVDPKTVKAAKPEPGSKPPAVPPARPLLTKAAYGKATEYVTVPAGEHVLEVRPTGFALPVKEQISLKAARGESLTLFAFGLLKGEDKQALAVTVVPDAP